jgi:hypothetical protein
MVRYKPKRVSDMNIDIVPKVILSGLLGGVEGYTGDRYFFCGSCNGSIDVIKGKTRPVVCASCGAEIDWTDIFTKYVSVCTQCGYRSETAKYCPNHVPAVALTKKEVEREIRRN